ncbi:hypothetical protein ACFTAO_51335 [Paenibacillus rhizoplanae]
MVTEVKGIVTYIKDADSFYIQSAAADMDTDIKTSEAIQIYQKGKKAVPLNQAMLSR